MRTIFESASDDGTFGNALVRCECSAETAVDAGSAPGEEPEAEMTEAFNQRGCGVAVNGAVSGTGECYRLRTDTEDDRVCT